MIIRPRRSVLYVPAANARALAKARSLDCDCVIVDLEDAVAPVAKDAARAAAVAALTDGGWGHREVLIRVNGLMTPWVEPDFAAARYSGAAAIIVPKINDAADAAAAVSRAGGRPVWTMIETPRGVLAADRIADVPGIAALVAGTADLSADLRVEAGADRLPLLYALSRIVLAARAAGLLAFDGVFGDIGDDAGLRREAEQGRALGFDGKTLIHPGQVATVNTAFAPPPEALAAAEGLIAAHATALADGRGVTTFAGRLIERLHVIAAQRMLAEAAAIAARTAA